MNWAATPLTCIALCWRVERGDGITIGLTAHDRDLYIEGQLYHAAPGMTPSAISRSATLDPDNMEVEGALNSDVISERDVLAGRWDGAEVIVFAADWRTGERRYNLGDGAIGAVEMSGGMLRAELRGAAAALEMPVVEETSPECRAMLGDKRCRVPMAKRRHFATVTAIAGNIVTLDHSEPTANAFGYGRLRWLSGANAGLEDSIAISSTRTATLRRPPRFADRGLVELIEGCDKSLATCAARFGNAVNFRGEPYLPGTDLLTRFPGG